MREMRKQTHPVITELPAWVLLLHKVFQVIIVVKVELRHQILEGKADILYCLLTKTQHTLTILNGLQGAEQSILHTQKCC